MPRLPALRVGVLAELARQLRFEPPAAARRHLARAEELAHQLIESAPDASAASGFPEDWIVFRITGLRGDSVLHRASEPALVIREALVADLPALIDRLSAAAELDPNEHPTPAWLSPAELCARWRISRKTLERYRRRGLVSRRITLGGGKQRVVFSRALVESFERRFAAELDAAGGFARLSKRERERIIARAARYRARFGWSLHRCAQRLAPRMARSIECIRLVLRDHDAQALTPIFDDPPPLDSADVERLEALARRGGRVSAATRAMRKSRSTGHRAVNIARASRLRSLTLTGPVGPGFDAPKVERTILGHDAARLNLGAAGASNASEVLRLAEQIDAEAAAFERARAAAYWYVLHSARIATAQLARHQPSSDTLDHIETRLRWASRIKAEMVRSQLPLLVRAIESQTQRPVDTIAPAARRELIVIGLDAIIDAVDRFDPFKGGRLAAPVGVALARALSAFLRGIDPEMLSLNPRLASRAEPALRGIEDWTHRVHDWQRDLDLPRPVRDALDTLEPEAQRVIRLRFGLGAGPPLTNNACAEVLGTKPATIRAVQRRVFAAAFGHWPESER